MEIKVDSATATALEVPLREPFTIATARMETTRAALFRIRAGETLGIGEAACLYPVTEEDMPDVLALAARSFRALEGRTVARIADCRDLAYEVSERSKVTASALECALLDALARSRGASIADLFGVRSFASRIESDITIPIAETKEMLRVGEVWHAQGFRAFKAKVGRDVDRETRALCTMHERLPGLRFRLDANAGFSAEDALAMLRGLRRHGAIVECFEQPCAREDVDGMAKVVRDGAVDVVADESLRGPDDLAELVRARAATSVNLKIVKLGGFAASLELGTEAVRRGLGVMVGGMVETRLGMTCATMLAACLPKLTYADLDTAWLLASDPFVGGFASDGPIITPIMGPGFGVTTAGDR